MALMMLLDGGGVSRTAQQAAANQAAQQQRAQQTTNDNGSSAAADAAAARAARLQRELEALLEALRRAQEAAREARRREAEAQARLTQARQQLEDAQEQARNKPTQDNNTAAHTAQQGYDMAEANAKKATAKAELEDRNAELADARVTQKREQQKSPEGSASAQVDQNVRDAETAQRRAQTTSTAADTWAQKEQDAQQAENHAASLEPPPGLPAQAYGKTDWDAINEARNKATRLRTEADAARGEYDDTQQTTAQHPLLFTTTPATFTTESGTDGVTSPTLLSYGNNNLLAQTSYGDDEPAPQYPLRPLLQVSPFPLPGAQTGSENPVEGLYAPPGTEQVSDTVAAIAQGKSVEEIARQRNVSTDQIISEAREAGVEITTTAASSGNGDVQTTTLKQGDVELSYYRDYQHDSLTVHGSYDDPAAPGGTRTIDAMQDSDGRIHHTVTDPQTGEDVSVITDYEKGTETRIDFDDQGRRVETTTEIGAGPVYYDVKPGDRAGEIANAHGMSMDEFLALNELANPNLIHPNDRLMVASAPSTVKVFNDDGSVMETRIGDDGKKQVVYISPEGERVTLAGDKSGEEAQVEDIRKSIFEDGLTVAQVAANLQMSQSQVLALMEPGTVEVQEATSDNGDVQTTTLFDPYSGEVVIERYDYQHDSMQREVIAGDTVFKVRQYDPETGKFSTVEMAGGVGYAQSLVDDRQQTVNGIASEISDLDQEIRTWQRMGEDASELYEKRRELSRRLEDAKAVVDIQQGKADEVATASDKATVITLAREFHEIQTNTRPGTEAHAKSTELLNDALGLIDQLSDVSVSADRNVDFLEADRDLQNATSAREDADAELEAQYQHWKETCWLWSGLDEERIKELKEQGAQPMGGWNRGYRNADEADQAARKEFAQAQELWDEMDDPEPRPERLAWLRRNQALEDEANAQIAYDEAAGAKGDADIAVRQHDIDALQKEKDAWVRENPDAYADAFPRQDELDAAEDDVTQLTIGGLLGQDDANFQRYLLTLPIGQRDTEERRQEALKTYQEDNWREQQELNNRVTTLSNARRRRSIDASAAYIEQWGAKHPELWAQYEALGQPSPTSSIRAAEHRMEQREDILATPAGELLRPAIEAQQQAESEERRISTEDRARMQTDLDRINKGIDNHSFVRDGWSAMFGDTADDAQAYTEEQIAAAEQLDDDLNAGRITLQEYVGKRDALMGAYNIDSADWAQQLRDTDETWGTIDTAVRTVLAAGAALGVTLATGNIFAGAAAGMLVNEAYDLVNDVDAMANGQALSNDGHVSLFGLGAGAVFTDDVTGKEVRMALKDKVIDGATNLVTGGGVAAGVRMSTAMTGRVVARGGTLNLGQRAAIGAGSQVVGQGVDGAGRVGVDTLQLAIEGKLGTPEGLERLRKSLANAGINVLFAPLGGSVSGAIRMDVLRPVTGVALQAMNDGAMNLGIAEVSALMLEGRHMNTGELVAAGMGTLPGTITSIAFHPQRMATARGYVGHLGADDGGGSGARRPGRDDVVNDAADDTVVPASFRTDDSADMAEATNPARTEDAADVADTPVATSTPEAPAQPVASPDPDIPAPASVTPTVTVLVATAAASADRVLAAAEAPGKPEASDGAEGADSADGADGRSDADDADGTDGTDGADGSDGTDGADGADGSDGADTAGASRDELNTLAANRGQGFWRRSRGVDVNLIPTTPEFSRLRLAMERLKGVQDVPVVAGASVDVRVRDPGTGQESSQNWLLDADGHTPLAPSEAAQRIEAAGGLPEDGSAVLILGCNLSPEYLGLVGQHLGRPVLTNAEMVHVFNTFRGSRIETGPTFEPGNAPSRTRAKSIDVRAIRQPEGEMLADPELVSTHARHTAPAVLADAEAVLRLSPEGAGIYRSPDDGSTMFWDGKSAEPVALDQGMGSQPFRSGSGVNVHALGKEWCVLVARGAPGALRERVALHEQLHAMFESHRPGFGDAHVVKMQGPIVLPDGRPALVARREPGSTRDSSYRQQISTRTGPDLAEIMQVLDDSGMQISDLQFLLTAEGKVMVNDPRAIYPREEGTQHVREQDYRFLARAVNAHSASSNPSWRVELGEAHGLDGIHGRVNMTDSMTACVNISVTIDRMLSAPGTRMSAVPSDAKTLADVRGLYGDPPIRRFDDSAVTMDHLSRLPDGSRGFVVLGGDAGDTSHMINYVVRDGEVVLIDGLSGRNASRFDAPVVHVIETQNGAHPRVDHTVRSQDDIARARSLADEPLPETWPQDLVAGRRKTRFESNGSMRPPLAAGPDWADVAAEAPRLMADQEAAAQGGPAVQLALHEQAWRQSLSSAMPNSVFVVSRVSGYDGAQVRAKRPDVFDNYTDAQAAAARLGGAYVHQVLAPAGRNRLTKVGHVESADRRGATFVSAGGEVLGVGIPNIHFREWQSANAPAVHGTQSTTTPQQAATTPQQAATTPPATQPPLTGPAPAFQGWQVTATSTGSVDFDLIIEGSQSFTAPRPDYAGPDNVANFDPQRQATQADADQTAYLVGANSPDGHKARSETLRSRLANYLRGRAPSAFGAPDYVAKRYAIPDDANQVLQGGADDSFGTTHVFGTFKEAQAAAQQMARERGRAQEVVRLVDAKLDLAAGVRNQRFTNGQTDGIIFVNEDGSVNPVSIANRDTPNPHIPRAGDQFIDPRNEMSVTDKTYSFKQRWKVGLFSAATMIGTAGAAYTAMRFGGASLGWSTAAGASVATYAGTRDMFLRYAFDAFLYRGLAAGFKQGLKVRMQKHASPDHDNTFALIKEIADPDRQEAALTQLRTQLASGIARRGGIGRSDRTANRTAIETLRKDPNDAAALDTLTAAAYQRAGLPMVGARGRFNRIPPQLRTQYEQAMQDIRIKPTTPDEVQRVAGAATLLDTAALVLRAQQQAGRLRGSMFVRNVPHEDRRRYRQAIDALARNPADPQAMLTLQLVGLDRVQRMATHYRGSWRGIHKADRHTIELEAETLRTRMTQIHKDLGDALEASRAAHASDPAARARADDAAHAAYARAMDDLRTNPPASHQVLEGIGDKLATSNTPVGRALLSARIASFAWSNSGATRLVLDPIYDTTAWVDGLTSEKAVGMPGSIYFAWANNTGLAASVAAKFAEGQKNRHGIDMTITHDPESPQNQALRTQAQQQAQQQTPVQGAAATPAPFVPVNHRGKPVKTYKSTENQNVVWRWIKGMGSVEAATHNGLDINGNPLLKPTKFARLAQWSSWGDANGLIYMTAGTVIEGVHAVSSGQWLHAALVAGKLAGEVISFRGLQQDYQGELRSRHGKGADVYHSDLVPTFNAPLGNAKRPTDSNATPAAPVPGGTPKTKPDAVIRKGLPPMVKLAIGVPLIVGFEELLMLLREKEEAARKAGTQPPAPAPTPTLTPTPTPTPTPTASPSPSPSTSQTPSPSLSTSPSPSPSTSRPPAPSTSRSPAPSTSRSPTPLQPSPPATTVAPPRTTRPPLNGPFMLSAGAQPFSASGLLATTVDVPAPRSVASPPNAALAQLFNLEGSSASPDSNELADFQVKPSSEAQVA